MSQSFGLPTGFFREPAVPDPPHRVTYDWILVGLMVIATVTEYFANTALIHRPWLNLFALVMIPTVLFRRSHPLKSMAFAFLAVNLMTISVAIGWEYPEGPYTLAFLLVHVYALFRWGSGRDCLIGLAIMAGAFFVGVVMDWNGFGEAIGGLLVLLFPAELGVIFRMKGESRKQAVDEARSTERERIARELHDSVAHHVSAIAIQAQAGQALAAQDPDAAVTALGVIEEAAARTLSEMRSMVGSLRDGSEAEYTPQPGLRDITTLAGSVGGLEVTVDAPNLDGAPAAVGTALYRISQESITNAVRHGKGASQVDVKIRRDGDVYRLLVSDNGRSNGNEPGPPGYGLIGMSERARLLGGTFEAGPSADGGWNVEAELPAQGAAR